MTNYLKRVLHDLLTAVDGETFAYGRIMGLIQHAVGMLLLAGVTVWIAATGRPSAAEWGAYLVSAGAYIAALAAASWALVSGTASTEPKPSKEDQP
ncbi:hypothetical protein QO010_000391 [Caulobacter ginsengisoli]|uniref:Uncharacterized protein n=1 Tax=Caulobacter ginsengisoli TaxID=400775 RepID=A0ABU0INA7_9CAUL|nr:hypothetical protein [Caulobacter ginsengisoli]MDQ0462643.1 hypothetical protein [Caulobacter ginsengisoli]